MHDDMVRRRDQIMRKLWSIEHDAPRRDAPHVRDAAERTARDLMGIARALGPADSPLEAGRTWKYIGDAWFTCSAESDPPNLRMAHDAYMRAAGLLEVAGHEDEIAMLNLGLGAVERSLELLEA